MALEGYKSNHNVVVVYSSKYHCVWTPKASRNNNSAFCG